MITLTEEQIMSQWGNASDIKVSVCCITYNQEKYITEAIDSFLMQKTNFPFEVIVGEDNSNDTTLNILYEYKKKFPNIIKLITSDRNVGANANLIRVFRVAESNYIAVCEGDDYWIDEYKLQKQYDALDANHNVNICFTAANTINPKGEIGKTCDYGKELKFFSILDVLNGGGGFMPTASLMIRKKIINDLPDCYDKSPVGDYFLQISGAISGGAMYLPVLTCVYRLNSVGSWSTMKFKKSENELINETNLFEECLRFFEKKGINSVAINKVIAKELYYVCNNMALGNKYGGFKKLIRRSFICYPFVTFGQAVARFFVIAPPFYSFLLSLKYKAKSVICNAGGLIKK